MPVLADRQWEKFAIELARGEKPVVAFELAGYPRHTSNAKRLADRAEIQQRVRELKDRALRRAEITVQRVVEGIGEIAFADNEEVGVTNKLKGLELLGKYLSIFQDNLNVNTSSDLANRMREAQARMRAKRDAPPMIEGSVIAAE